MDYQTKLLRSRYADAALSINGLQQPDLWNLASFLCRKDDERLRSKGRLMSDDHLKQEAVKWVKAKNESRWR